MPLAAGAVLTVAVVMCLVAVMARPLLVAAGSVPTGWVP
jgi:hypothetical protein